jgi:hypothetical protein
MKRLISFLLACGMTWLMIAPVMMVPGAGDSPSRAYESRYHYNL